MLDFTQNDIEKEISDLIPHRMRREIARLTGVYESIVYAFLNPDDERKSPAFQMLQMQAAIDELDPVTGDAVWQRLCQLRELSRPRSSQDLSLDDELSKSVKEDADCVMARFNGKSLYEQLREHDESIRQKVKSRDAILDAINDEKENGGRQRLSTRDYARREVSKFRSVK